MSERILCPTCQFFGITKGDGEGGVLFEQSSVSPSLYECDYAEHFFDQETLDMIATLQRRAESVRPAEQARQAKGDSQNQSAIDRARNREIDRKVYESFYPGSTGNPTE